MEVYVYMCMCIYMHLCMYVGTLISIHIDPHTSEPFFCTSHSQARLACYRQLLADALSLTADALPLTRIPLVQAHRSAEHEKRPASSVEKALVVTGPCSCESLAYLARQSEMCITAV